MLIACDFFVFLFSCHSAADMAFFFIYLQNILYLREKHRVFSFKSFADILMYSGFTYPEFACGRAYSGFVFEDISAEYDRSLIGLDIQNDHPL